MTGTPLGTLGSAKVAIEADLAGFASELRKASRLLDSATQRMEQGAKTSGAGILKGLLAGGAIVVGLHKIVNAGQAVVRVLHAGAEAALEFGKEVTRTGAAFERDLALVGTLSDEARGGLDRFRADVIELGIDGGKSFEGLNQALFDNVSGLQDAARARTALNAANDLALAGNTQVAVGMTAIVRVLRAYGLGLEHSQTIADKVFAAMQGGVVTVEELSQHIAILASVAAETGLSLDELFGVVSRATQIEDARKVLTGLRQVFIQVSAATEGLKDRSREMAAEMGVVGFEFSSAHLKAVGLVRFLAELDRVVGGDTARLTEFKIGAESLTAALAILGDGVAETAARIDDIAASEGRAADAAEFMKKQTATQVERMTNLWLGFKVALFKELLEPWLGNLEDLSFEYEDLQAAASAFADVIRIAMLGAVAVTAHLGAELATLGATLLRVTANAAAVAAVMSRFDPSGAGAVTRALLPDAESRDDMRALADGLDVAAAKARGVAGALALPLANALGQAISSAEKLKTVLAEIDKRREAARAKRLARDAAPESTGAGRSFGGTDPEAGLGPRTGPVPRPDPKLVAEYDRIAREVVAVSKDASEALLDVDRGTTEKQLAAIRLRYTRLSGEIARNEKLTNDQWFALHAELEGAKRDEETAALLGFQAEVAEMVRGHHAELATIDGSETERQVQAFRDRYAKIREEIERLKLDPTGLDDFLNFGEQQIRGSDGALDEAANGDNFIDGFTASIRKMQKETGKLGQLGALAGRSFSTMGSSIADVGLGLVDAGDAAKQFLMNLVRQMLGAIIQAAILAGLMSLITGGATAAAGGTSFATAFASILGIAKGAGTASGGTDGDAAFGGAFRVLGQGGVDRNRVTLGVSRNEVIRVDRTGNAPGGGGGRGVQVIVNEAPGTKTTVSTGQNDGMEVVMIEIENRLAQSVQDGGTLGQAVAETFDVPRRAGAS